MRSCLYDVLPDVGSRHNHIGSERILTLSQSVDIFRVGSVTGIFGERLRDSIVSLIRRRNIFVFLTCSIPDDHISPRRSALFMARSVLRDIRDGERAC